MDMYGGPQGPTFEKLTLLQNTKPYYQIRNSITKHKTLLQNAKPYYNTQNAQ